MLDSSGHTRDSLVQSASCAANSTWQDGVDFDILRSKLFHQQRVIYSLVVAGALIASIAGGVYSFLRTPVFSASTAMLISNTSLQLSGSDAVVTQLMVENSLIQSQLELLKSGKVLGRVVDDLGIETIEAMLPSANENVQAIKNWIVARYEMQKTRIADRRQKTLEALKSNMDVTRVGSSQVIAARLMAATAEDAASLANEVARSFVREQNEANALVTTSATMRERIKILGPGARIISDATPPQAKDGPRALVILVLAAAIGAGLGFAISVAFALLDKRVRTTEQLVRLSSAECFGYMPRIDKFMRKSLRRRTLRRELNFQDDENALIRDLPEEFIPVLRRAQVALMERSSSSPRVIGITSCCEGEGRTTVAINFACLMARQGQRVLLVEAAPDAVDTSRRQAPETMNGVRQVLTGEVLLSDATRTIGCDRFEYLPIGVHTFDIDTRWPELLRAINLSSPSYEWIVLDLPSLSPIADVRSISQILDELIIVIEWGRISERRLDSILRSLGPARSNLFGIIINKAPRYVLPPHTSPGGAAYRSSHIEPAGHQLDNIVERGRAPS